MNMPSGIEIFLEVPVSVLSEADLLTILAEISEKRHYKAVELLSSSDGKFEIDGKSMAYLDFVEYFERVSRSDEKYFAYAVLDAGSSILPYSGIIELFQRLRLAQHFPTRLNLSLGLR
jgi:hypothetical protein